jgi:TrpR-related protein YerC/YecD
MRWNKRRTPDWKNADTDALLSAVLSLRTKGEAQNFFRDLLTEPELLEFGSRWKAARLLARKTPYLEIAEATGLSSTTIARVKHWLTSGTGGYQIMLGRGKAHASGKQ